MNSAPWLLLMGKLAVACLCLVFYSALLTTALGECIPSPRHVKISKWENLDYFYVYSDPNDSQNHSWTNTHLMIFSGESNE